MALFEIKHRLTGAVLFSLETKNMRLCVEAAVRTKTSLDGASLDGASLVGANLDGASLDGANLDGANLVGANLVGASLDGASLVGAKIRNGITITKPPIQILGLTWPVTIWDAHMRIGCEFHSHDQWAAFTEADWIRMGGKPAALMLRNEYPAIKLLCERHAVKPEQEAA